MAVVVELITSDLVLGVRKGAVKMKCFSSVA